MPISGITGVPRVGSEDRRAEAYRIAEPGTIKMKCPSFSGKTQQMVTAGLALLIERNLLLLLSQVFGATTERFRAEA